ncbi:hypothetical protein CVT26_007225 [Gymnopilus dilepis]|uniref:Uncharacterized protein n=1 Tax=Gymnopilus dilepis TaxID=231916 RepID=A0A409XDE5_9AGAR|nr:hypothetical protein CVT26_007225 [Gymnopilus dilepis]
MRSRTPLPPTHDFDLAAALPSRCVRLWVDACSVASWLTPRSLVYETELDAGGGAASFYEDLTCHHEGASPSATERPSFLLLQH